MAFYDAPNGGAAVAQVVIGKVGARQVAVPDLPESAKWAEVLALAAPPPLRLSAPVAADDADYSAWIAALGQGDAGAFDLVPILTGGAVALAGADGVLDPEGPLSSPRIERMEGETEAECRIAGIGAGRAGVAVAQAVCRGCGARPGFQGADAVGLAGSQGGGWLRRGWPPGTV
ncbi:MAG: hypothetical protein V9G14_10260 [Cypionkella sp.]